MGKNNEEIHLLISWEKANLSKEVICSYLPNSVKVLLHFKYIWDKKHAEKNFAAFYGQKLEDISYKVDHCGSGPFDIYILNDSHPNYEMRHTTSGDNKVNANIFDVKKKLREISHGSHLVHGTDNTIECKQNIASLFGISVEELLEKYKNSKDSIIEIHRNICGVPFWDSWEELFRLLNVCTDYVVLRNSKTVLENDHSLHGDTDILVKDRSIADVILAARKIHENKFRVMYETQFENGPQLIDVRYVGDNYYCEKWEKDILRTREMHGASWLFVPNMENLKYSLLYHALVHKPCVSCDYKEFIIKEFNTFDRKSLIEILKKYITTKGYSFTLPSDTSVFINPDFYSEIKVPAFTRVKYTLRKYMNESDDKNAKRRDKAIFKVLYKGHDMVRRSYRKIKKIIKGKRHTRN